MDRAPRSTTWATAIATFLAIGVIAWWTVRSGADAAPPRDPAIGQAWTTLQSRWGTPVCSAATARLQSRESAARRPEGKSGLVIPHAELLLVGATPPFGPGSVASNRVLVFTSDLQVTTFLRRIASGDLAGHGVETRVAIDRARPVHVVEVDAAGRVRSVRDLRPVFVTHQPR